MYIHIADFTDANVRMILPPSADGQAPIVRTYTVSGLDVPQGMAFDGTHIHIADRDDANVRMILPPSADGQAPIVRTYTVSGLGEARGMAFDGTHIHIADSNDDNVRMILPPSADGQAPIVRTYTVSGAGRVEGMAFDGTHIHIADRDDDNVRMILPPSTDGQAPTVFTYTVGGVNNNSGMTFDGTHIHVSDLTDDNVRMILPPSSGGQAPIVRTYTVSGVNVLTGMAFDGSLVSQAILTLTTTDTDIRAGEVVDIDIASDIDITDFTASDISVTGGTRGALTGSDMDWTLSVTAGSAGTMTVAIAEDAVSPGNVAVSQNFTVNARATATITFDDASGESGGSTGVNIAFSESVTGLQLSELTASAGTLSNLTGSGTSWEAALAFPATGSGTVTVSLAQDSTTPQNASASATIDYAEAADPLVLAWVIPTEDVGNDFSVTLTSNYPVTGVERSDFRLIQRNPTQFYNLTADNSTIVAVAGTNNWRIDFTLDGTYDNEFAVRLVREMVVVDGVNVPVTANLSSSLFRVDSSVGAEALDFGSETIANQAWVVGTAASLTLPVATGGTGAITYSLSPTLPSGKTFTASTRVLAGTPTGRFSSATFTYTATDANGDTVELTFTIVVNATAITFNPTSFANQTWEVNTAVSLTLPEGAGGVGSLIPTLTPSLPSGVSFTASTRALAGNPTGTFTSATFTYTMTDEESESESITFTIVVNAETLVSTTVVEISGDDQSSQVSTALDAPFVVEVRDQNGDGLSGVTVAFAVTAGGGTLSASSVTTDSSGQAESTLTLGSTVGTNTVTADVSGISTTITFTATGTAEALVATTLVRVSGNNQTAVVSTALPNPFVVEVRDQNGDGLAGVAVTFAVTGGGGALSATSVTTGSNGRAQATLTLGSTVGANAVRASVSGITTTRNFNATGEAGFGFGSETIADQAWEIGTAVSLTLPAATGGTGTITYSLSPTTPPGVTFTAGTRALAGNPILEFSSAAFTYTATAGTESVTLTFRIVVTDPSIVSTSRVYESHSVGVNVVIDGQDMTEYLPARAGLSIGRGRDFPNLGVFKSGGVTIPLQNASGMFDPGNPSNFFVSRSLPANGRGAKVLLRITRDGAEVFNIAGEIAVINQSLASSLVSLIVRDLSLRLRQTSVEDFGQTIVRRITDYEGANTDYDELNPVFYFPTWALLSQGSVTMTVEEGGSDVTINVVDAVAKTGVLSNLNAEVDYSRGLIRFEAAPTDGEDTIIDATWKQDYVYKRPDFLIRSLLENVGIDTRIGITDDTDARFAIEQALVRHDTDRIFSTHGRPYFGREGLAKWMMLDGNIRYFAHENRLVQYNDTQDEYSEMSELPSEDTDVQTDFGEEVTEAQVTFTLADPTSNDHPGAVVDGNFYITRGERVRVYDASGNYVSQVISSTNWTIQSMSYGPTDLYMLHYSAGVALLSAYNFDGFRIDYGENLEDDDGNNFAIETYSRISIGWDSPYLMYITGDQKITVFGSISFAYQSEISLNYVPDGIAVGPRFIYILDGQTIRVHDLQGNEQPGLTISTPVMYDTILLGEYQGELLLYGWNRAATTVYAHRIDPTATYDRQVAFQFDSADFNTFYTLSSNTLSADMRDTRVTENRIMKYEKSTDTWTKLLDMDTGQPQPAHPNDFVSEIAYYGDNRKNFQVVSRNNKTFIFYRRVESSPLQASIAYFNETDNVIANIRSETFTDADNAGVPYSMDFAIDEQSDGIHVYSFVVRYATTSATLKVFRERVEPSGAETEIFTESFTFSATTDYPISVSDVILADDRSKWYFVLNYFNNHGTTVSKSELCTIAKNGSGSRTILKTYTNPLFSARSPVKLGDRYFYLEGGSLRRPKTSDDAPDAEHYYPDEGGHLIEVESNDSITDHGIVWRSASKSDSPDPGSDVYDGWGLHNAILSNMVVDDRGNASFICGYGMPYQIDKNLPISEIEPVSDASNFVRVQWGQDLATKIPSFATAGNRSWDAIQNLARAMNWETGFGPRKRKVDALQAADSTISDWSANASLFFRPRTILPAKLRTAIVATGSPASIELNHSGLPAELSEFPSPPTGVAYRVLIDKEIFSYTAAAVDSQGVTLSGTTREVNGSVAQAHDADEGVFFVDSVIRDTDVSLVGVDTKQTDLGYLYNAVIIRHADGTYRVDDSESIEANGERALSLSMPFLSNETFNWLSLIAARYLDKFKAFKDVITLRVPYSPLLELGQLVILKTGRGFVLDYEKFEIMRITDNLQKYQTTLILRGY